MYTCTRGYIDTQMMSRKFGGGGELESLRENVKVPLSPPASPE